MIPRYTLLYVSSTTQATRSSAWPRSLHGAAYLGRCPAPILIARQDMPPVPGVILAGDRFTAGGWVSGNPALTMSRENSSTGAPRPPVDLRYIHVSALMSATLRLPS